MQPFLIISSKILPTRHKIFCSCLPIFSKNDFQDPFNMYQASMIIISFLWGRGVHSSWVPTYLPLKIVFTCWLVVATLLCWAYLSQLFSFIVLSKFEQPIDTAEDVLKSDLPLMITTWGWQKNLLTQKNPGLQQVYQKNVVEKDAEMVFFSDEYINFLANQLRNGEGNIIIQNINMTL